jgi:hypothetical protein
VKAALVWKHVRVSGTQEYFAPYLVLTTEEAWPRFKRAALSARAEAQAGRVRSFSRMASIERWGCAVPWHVLCNRRLRLEPGTVLFFESVEELRRWFAERVNELLKTEEGRRNALERLEEWLRRAEKELAGFKAPERGQPYRAVKVITFKDDLPPATKAIYRRGALLNSARESGASVTLKEYGSSLLLLVRRSGEYADEFRLVWLRKGSSSKEFLEEVLELGKDELEAVHEALEWTVELARECGRLDIASYAASLLGTLRLIL